MPHDIDSTDISTATVPSIAEPFEFIPRRVLDALVVRIFRLDTGAYVFRMNPGAGPYMTKILCQGETIPEADGLTVAERKKFMNDCLFKRVRYVHKGVKSGYHMAETDYDEFIRTLSAGHTVPFAGQPDGLKNIRVVLYQSKKKPQIVLTRDEKDRIDSYDIRMQQGLEKVNGFVSKTQKALVDREKERMSRAAKKAEEESTTDVRKGKKRRDVQELTIHELAFTPEWGHFRMAIEQGGAEYADLSRCYLIPVVRGINLMEITMDDLERTGYETTGSSYYERRKNMPNTSLHKHLSYVVAAGVPMYVLPVNYFDEFLGLMTKYRPDVRIVMVSEGDQVYVEHEPSPADVAEGDRLIEEQKTRKEEYLRRHKGDAADDTTDSDN